MNGCAPRRGTIWSQAPERFPPADRVLSTILRRQAARYGDRTLFVFGRDALELRADGGDRRRLGAPPESRRACGPATGSHDVLEPPGIPASLSRLRLDGRGHGADQRRAARHPARPHLAQFDAALLVVEARCLRRSTRWKRAVRYRDLRSGRSAKGRRVGAQSRRRRCRRSASGPRPRRCGRATRSRSSTRRAPPARQRASAARRRSCSGGASIRRARSASAKATCCSRRCRCSTPTR